MDKEITGILNEYISAVAKQNPNFFKAYLFGSYATNRHHKDSDIDIAVVIKDYSDFFDVQMELMRLRRKIDSRIEPHPFREKDFVSVNPLVFEIQKYGQEI